MCVCLSGSSLVVCIILDTNATRQGLSTKFVFATTPKNESQHQHAKLCDRNGISACVRCKRVRTPQVKNPLQTRNIVGYVVRIAFDINHANNNIRLSGVVCVGDKGFEDILWAFGCPFSDTGVLLSKRVMSKPKLLRWVECENPPGWPIRSAEMR